MKKTALVLAFLAAISGAVAHAADEPEISLSALPPVVVRTVPESGDVGVDPALTQVTVTFSKEMRGRAWSWVTLSRESFPQIAGEIHYLPGNRTCVAPVKLEPDRTYAIYLNTDRFTNFKDTSGRPALPYLLVFRTRK
jgi:RNA polymerase sigma-70 factor (ECF subfamily)